ncbi:MAG TPA: GWxTD domain-containing protein, partial [Acidobacteriota bacterium]|nr:GWxTD domain-containing protein [Acidobacteriota bacterium]
RRIRYVNERFDNEGKPGWKTLRGQIYIVNGPPDDVHYSYGGQQKVSVPNPTDVLNKTGLGLPFIDIQFPTPESEMWIYRRIAGSHYFTSYFCVLFSKIDSNEIYVFQKNISRIPPDAPRDLRARRDLMILEFITKQSYFRNDYQILYAGEPRFRDLEDLLDSIFHSSHGNEIDPFSVNEAVADLLRSTGDRIEEQLARRTRMEELVRGRVYYRTLAVEIGFGFLRDLSGQVTLPIHAEISGSTDVPAPRVMETLVELVSAESGRIVAETQDQIRPKLWSKTSAGGKTSYQCKLSAPPGAYRLRVIVAEGDNKRIGLWEKDIAVPNLSTHDFGVGEIIICQQVLSRNEANKLSLSRSRPDWTPAGEEYALALDDFVFIPSASRKFRRGQNLTALIEVYNPTLRSKSPSVQLQAVCTGRGGRALSTAARELNYLTGKTGDMIVYGFTVPLRDLDPGPYDFLVRVTDTPTGRVVEKKAEFEVW